MTWIFGYGSLIHPDSRARTGVTGTAIPVRVRGWQRAWNALSEKFGMAALGVVPQAGAGCNGVLVEVPDNQLGEFDKREAMYARTRLDPAEISALEPHRLSPDEAWIYVPLHPERPTTACPIVQSYVDVVLAGCLTIGEAFATEFMRTTALWDAPLVNDRWTPRYPRAEHFPADVLDRVDALVGEQRRVAQTRG
jgi:cation transport regulator ChaC